uniref:TonB-dependent receptor n=1 Tax=Phenylobacterium glaciei TaxID=2803784 RepID=A0A974P2I8_9CAUL|nr:TonB-dependent receptor [Phenylobacterium glaciei]
MQDSGGSLSGRGNLAWQFADNAMTYVSYARGYKGGGLNMSGLQLTGGTGPGANQPALDTAVIEDEQNSTFEVGLKSTLFGGRATLNLAAYKTIVKDFQANIATPVTGNNSAPLRTFPANIPKCRSRAWRPTSRPGCSPVSPSGRRRPTATGRTRTIPPDPVRSSGRIPTPPEGASP